MNEEQEEVAKVEEVPNYPSITLEIQGQDLVIKYNFPLDTNSTLFSVFLHRLNNGEYQGNIISSLAKVGQESKMLPLVTKIIEQLSIMSKNNKVAISPLEVLKSRGE